MQKWDRKGASGKVQYYYSYIIYYITHLRFKFYYIVLSLSIICLAATILVYLLFRSALLQVHHHLARFQVHHLDRCTIT